MQFAPNKPFVLLQLILLVSVPETFSTPWIPPNLVLAQAPSHHHHNYHHHHGPVHPPMEPPVHTPVHPPVHPPVKPPVHPPVKPPAHPPVHPPLKPPVKPPVHPPVYPPVKPPVHPPVKPPVHHPVYPPVKPPVHPPVSPPPRKFIAVEGVVYCESCKYRGKDSLVNATLISGAEVKLECNNTAKPIVVTAKTNKKGYFLILAPETITSYAFHKCKVSLGSSGLRYCKKPAKLNGGRKGAVLKPLKPVFFNELAYILYFVGPFSFEPTCHRV